MNRQDRQHLLAEQKFLQERLEQLPATARLTRKSLESRLRGIAESLTQAPLDEREPARVRLTFNGRPVIGTHGIFAEFGVSAISRFNEAVATVAASLNTVLAPKGPVPNREQYQLIITGAALGSFGFELEEYRAGQLPLEEASPVAQALERTQSLLRGTLGSDEDLADSASDTDQRALDKVRAFLQTLADNEAICTMQYQDNSVRFTDVGQVRNSLARLSQDNIVEKEEFFDGSFHGYLPRRRTFEFRLSGSDEVISCKVGSSIQDAETINQHLYTATRIKVMATRVGSGRPRYVLIEMPEWNIAS